MMNALSLLKPLMLVALLAGLAACGRAGPLEPPPSKVIAPDEDAAEPEQEDRRFILDGLLN